MLMSRGVAMRRLIPTPGLLNAVLHRWIVATKGQEVPPARTDVFVTNGDRIPLAGGIAVLHAPGHTEGHLAFHLPEKSVVFVGDAAANLLGVRLMPAYEHLRQGIMSLHRLCHLDFRMACFGHGPTILEDADRRFRERWGSRKNRTRGGRVGRRRSFRSGGTHS
jgi:glyoxylase-like metal-dependent hydrolase (beta-lactamase superfamily II)